MSRSSFPIVLLHGFPLGPAMWDAQRVALEAAGHRVATPWLPGFGKDPSPSGGTIEACAEALLKSMRAEKTRPGIVVGFSMGGYVALEMAHREPEALAGLVLASTRADPDSAEVAAKRRELAAEVERKGARHLFETMKEKMLGPELVKDAGLVRRLESIVVENTGPGMATALRGLALRPDQRPRLSQISVPTLVLHNKDDALIPVEGGGQLAEAIRGSKFVTFPGHAHLVNWEHEAAFNRTLLEWARELPSSTK